MMAGKKCAVAGCGAGQEEEEEDREEDLIARTEPGEDV
jgi:hypothetical protein